MIVNQNTFICRLFICGLADGIMQRKLVLYVEVITLFFLVVLSCSLSLLISTKHGTSHGH